MIYSRISCSKELKKLLLSNERIISNNSRTRTPTEEIKTDISIRGKSFRYFYSRNIPIGRFFIIGCNITIRIEITYSRVTRIVALRNSRINRRESVLNCKNKVFTCLVSYTVDTEICAFAALRYSLNLFRCRSVL